MSNDHGCGQHDHRRHSEPFAAPARNFWVPKVMPRRRHSSRQSFKTLSPAGTFRLRSRSKRLSRDVLIYERKVLSVREKERTNWRHGSPAESAQSRACRPSLQAAESPRREWFREKFPLRALDSFLWRSRGTKGWVRAVPGGAPPAAAEGMDGPDDARIKSPWWGRG